MAEELRLDEGGRESGEVERVEEVAESRREALRARVEGDVAREADGARATTSLPVPDGPTISVVTSSIRS